MPYAAAHAFRLFDLPTHHADPFDRQIIAQALVEDVPVGTPDEGSNLATWQPTSRRPPRLAGPLCSHQLHLERLRRRTCQSYLCAQLFRRLLDKK